MTLLMRDKENRAIGECKNRVYQIRDVKLDDIDIAVKFLKIDKEYILYVKNVIERSFGIHDLYYIHNRLGVDINTLFECVDPEGDEFITYNNRKNYTVDEMIDILCTLVGKFPDSDQADVYMRMIQVFTMEARKVLGSKQ